MSDSPQQSPSSKFFESLLVGAVEAIARAGAKAAESVAGDVKKALKNEAMKAELLEMGIEAWRKVRLGDPALVPTSLGGDPGWARGSAPFSLVGVDGAGTIQFNWSAGGKRAQALFDISVTA